MSPSRSQRTQLNALGTTRSTFLFSWLPDSKFLQGGSERYNAASILDGTVTRSLKRIGCCKAC